MDTRIRCPGPGCGLEISAPDKHCPGCGIDLEPLLRLIETGHYYYNEALKHISEKDYLAAIECLAVARAFNPRDAGLYVLTAKTYIKLDIMEKAAEFFLKAYRLEKKSTAAREGLQWLSEAGFHINASSL
jgi:tetratricopeptide (TPR) repeat protein